MIRKKLLAYSKNFLGFSRYNSQEIRAPLWYIYYYSGTLGYPTTKLGGGSNGKTQNFHTHVSRLVFKTTSLSLSLSLSLSPLLSPLSRFLSFSFSLYTHF